MLHHLGTPKHRIRVKLVTNSQASIMILDKTIRAIGMKPFLELEMDVAMEIIKQRKLKADINLEVYKVKSYITIDEVPNKQFWSVNTEADDLATIARRKVQEGIINAYPPIFLKGAQAICEIGGRLCLTEIKQAIKTDLYTSDLQMFLLTKYDWTQRILEMIDWKAHSTAVGKMPYLQSITGMK